MNLVLDHVLEPLVISWAEENHNFKLSTVEPIIHDLVTAELVSLLVQ